VSARSKSRKRAVDVLFEAEQRKIDPRTVLRRLVEAPDGEVNPYTTTLVEGVLDHKARIDELIGTYSVGWSLDRMPAVDRTVLRLGVFEILWSEDVPDAVAVDQAVELARSLSTDDSPTFINGLLGRIVELKPMLGESA